MSDCYPGKPSAIRRLVDVRQGSEGISLDRASISAGQRPGPDQLRSDVAQLRIGSLGGVGEDGARLVLFDLVPLHQDPFGLLNTYARHHDGAELSEIIAGRGCDHSAMPSLRAVSLAI